MTEQIHTYQAMFLLDNQEVRKGFNAARDWVKETLEKHGLTVKVLRLWGERPLAYPVGGRRRATYVLGWLEGSGASVNKVKREMYLLGPVFRTLFLQEDEIPAEELAFGVEEIDEAALVIPEDEPEEELEELPPSEESEEASSEESAEGKSDEKGEEKAEESSEKKSEDKEPVAAASTDTEEQKDA